jgi:hypothetical protein
MNASRCDGLSPGFKRVQGSNGRLVKNEVIPVDQQAVEFLLSSGGPNRQNDRDQSGARSPNPFRQHCFKYYGWQ